MPAKTMGWTPSLPLLAARYAKRLAAVDPEAGSEVLRLLSERREDLVAERTRALKAACTDFYETSCPVG